MPTKKRSGWGVKVYANQLDEIDADLMTQLVVMLGRQLAEEAENDTSDSSTDESIS